jgi:hypothetical protein
VSDFGPAFIEISENLKPAWVDSFPNSAFSVSLLEFLVAFDGELLSIACQA